ncbi:YjbE family putative metal transport protein [Hyphomicrobium sp.]|uniref:YjbE family putative metal transport protein n=1 Tax=Hyphomicrobium sp. TaxID=82 RepID=UPI0025C4EA86|nr:YjbE family putative metal transport protein [Hyphomicrobium sp.]MCC7254153.1 YjbE family putative metal transport protein [Hyphomicrobium sp.]
MLQWISDHAVELINIIIIDLTLAGDNAIVVGMAASRVAPQLRAKVIFWGIAGAVILRVLFSGVAVQLLQIIGLTLAGGLLLLFVAWKMYRQLVDGSEHSIDEVEANVASTARHPGEVSFWSALWTIILADVSMSLDNVLAVAGVAQGAQEPLPVLIIGLGLAIILMAVASTYIARLLAKYPWIAWIGLLIILWVALDMIYTDSHKITCATYNIGCSETLWQAVLHRLGLGPSGPGG